MTTVAYYRQFFYESICCSSEPERFKPALKKKLQKRNK